MTISKSVMPYVLGGVLVPGAVMFGARYFGQAPSRSNAQSLTTPAPEIYQFPDISLSNTTTAHPLKEDAAIDSPFWFEEFNFDEYTAPTQTLSKPRPVVETQVPEFFVTAILPSPKNPMAVINGKPYRIGDEIVPGWKLLAIDGKARTIFLIHRSGKRLSVGLSKNN